MTGSTADDTLLDVQGLRAWIGTPRGPVRAVDGVSVAVRRGQSLGIVGESGSGKSMLARAIMGLLPQTAAVTGSIMFDGQQLVGLAPDRVTRLWGSRIAMVFQDPGRSLNPVVRIDRQLTEGMRRHLGLTRAEARNRAVDLLTEVGVPSPERRLSAYPHELSGGMRQRVMLAIALSCEPDLLIADEPTTALDVTIQRQILELLTRIQHERHMAMILISHDLAVVAGRTDQVAVMYGGRISETGPTPRVFAGAAHWYTTALLESTPRLDQPAHQRLPVIVGSPPDLVSVPTGCRFAARCGHRTSECSATEPELGDLGGGHLVACVNPVGSPARTNDGGNDVR